MGDISMNGATLAVVSGIIGAIVLALTTIFRLYVAALQNQISDLKERLASMQKLAEKNVDEWKDAAKAELASKGMTGAALLAAVPASHNSPVSEQQQFAADFESLKAQQIAAELALTQAITNSDTIPTTPQSVRIDEISPKAAAAIAEAAKEKQP